MGARWYTPANGQFTSRDTAQVNPVPSEAAANPFAYAADNPLTGTDPTGHMIVAAGGGGYYPRVAHTYHPPPQPTVPWLIAFTALVRYIVHLAVQTYHQTHVASHVRDAARAGYHAASRGRARPVTGWGRGQRSAGASYTGGWVPGWLSHKRPCTPNPLECPGLPAQLNQACQWSDLVPNVAKNLRFGGKDYPFYEGYLGWGP